MSDDDTGPSGALGSLAIAHTMALATIIDILVRDKVIDHDEITSALTKVAKDIRKNKKLGGTGPRSLDTVARLVRESRERRNPV